jgi:DNA uptake protein ComE-like DNA-binding protein
VLVAPLTCGILSFVGFLVAAIRTGKRKYWISTAVYAVLWTVLMVMILAPPEDSLMYDLAAIPLLASMIVPAVHAAIWNKDYLTTIAHKGAWHAQYAAPTQTLSPPQATQGFLGVSNAGYYAPGTVQPPPAPSVPSPPPAQQSVPAPPARQATTLNINTASASDLVAALGIDQALADQVIGARHARGGFRDIDDLATGAGLQPHQLIRFRNRVSFFTPPQGHDPNTQTGRILDF